MTGFLEGRIALVAGGGRRIGRSIAMALVVAGARVTIVGRDASVLAQAASAIGAEAVQCDDVTIAADCALWSQRVPADILVNNAGINPAYLPAERVDDTSWDSLIATNLTVVFRLSRQFGAGMLERQGGAIVNIGSIAGRVGLPRTVAYCAAKGGIEQLTKARAAIDWASRGVRVNCVAPGYVKTDLTRGVPDHPYLSRRIVERTPMGRFGVPEEVAGAVVFLASDAERYVTGQSLAVDGGWTPA